MADPVEISEAGYASLRAHIVETWTYLELHTSGGTPVLARLHTGTDPRVTWTISTGQILEVTVVLSGDDADVVAHGLPLTITGAQIFAVATGGSGMVPAQQFTPATLGDASDTLTIRQQIQIPEVVSGV